MKRSGFKRPERARAPRPPLVLGAEPSRAVMRVVDRDARCTVVPKAEPSRSEAYRRLVAAMPCAHCKRPGPSQCAHADQGKGLSIKADDRDTYPACADGPGRRGCHSLIGSTGTFTRAQRRRLEDTYAAQTRAAICAAGDWPKGLPVWPEDEDQPALTRAPQQENE